MSNNKATIDNVRSVLKEASERDSEVLSTFLQNEPLTFSQWSKKIGVPVTTLHSRVTRYLEKNPELREKHLMYLNGSSQIDRYLRDAVMKTPEGKVLLDDYCRTHNISAARKTNIISGLDRIKSENPAYYERNVEVFSHKRYIDPKILEDPQIAQQLKISDEEFENSSTLSEIGEELGASVEDLLPLLKEIKERFPTVYKENYYGYFLGEYYVSSVMRADIEKTYSTSLSGFLRMSEAARKVGLIPLYVQAKVRQIKNEDPEFYKEHSRIRLHQCYIDEEFIERIDELNDMEDDRTYTFREVAERLNVPSEDYCKLSRWIQHCKNNYHDAFFVQDRYYVTAHGAHFSLGLVEMLEELWRRRNNPRSHIPDSEPID